MLFLKGWHHNTLMLNPVDSLFSLQNPQVAGRANTQTRSHLITLHQMCQASESVIQEKHSLEVEMVKKII